MTDLENIHSGRRPIGASTITQQVAKNMILGNVSTFSTKIKEAILAMRMERTLPKEKILEIYLNEIYLGARPPTASRAAAQTYFDKPLDQLTIAEAAFLGALPKGPKQLQSVSLPAGGAGPSRLGARPHGRHPRDHRRRGARGEGGPRWCRPACTGRR